MLDSIAVSVFVDIFIEFDKYCTVSDGKVQIITLILSCLYNVVESQYLLITLIEPVEHHFQLSTLPYQNWNINRKIFRTPVHIRVGFENGVHLIPQLFFEYCILKLCDIVPDYIFMQTETSSPKFFILCLWLVGHNFKTKNCKYT